MVVCASLSLNSCINILDIDPLYLHYVLCLRFLLWSFNCQNLKLSRSSISETPKKSTTPRASKIKITPSKISRGNAKSESDAQFPSQSSRLSIDRSPRSVVSKPTLERRSPKIPITTPPEVSLSKGTLFTFLLQ